MVELGTLANLAEIFGAITIIGAAIFAVVQIQQARKQRHDAAAIELARATFQHVEYLDAERLILRLREGASADEVRAGGEEMLRAAFIVGSTFETLGLLVHRRVMDFDMATALVGGVCGGTWSRLRAYILDLRRDMGFEAAWEWFQWLAERIEEHAPEKKTAGAHVTEAGWLPR